MGGDEEWIFLHFFSSSSIPPDLRPEILHAAIDHAVARLRIDLGAKNKGNLCVYFRFQVLLARDGYRISCR